MTLQEATLLFATMEKVLAFHIYNRDMFEDYLLDNTKFETASLGKHNFGRVYERSGEYFINLNLQIRFR